MNLKVIIAAGALALAAGSANATVTFYGYGTGAPSLTLLDNFSSDTVGAAPSSTAAYTWTGGGKIFNGSTPGIVAAPATSATTFDTGNFLGTLAGKSSTITLTTPIKELEVYIGSLDSFNTISFSDGESFTGDALRILSGANDSSSQTSPTSNGMFDFKFASSVNSVTFTDGGLNAFEVASLSKVTALPEPATWAMMIMGFFGLGAAMRFGRRAKAVIA